MISSKNEEERGVAEMLDWYRFKANTMRFLGINTFAKDLLAARGALNTMTAVLLDKGGNRAAEIEADFKGFDCPERFVIGYGMDMAHAFRELPFVGCFVED